MIVRAIALCLPGALAITGPVAAHEVWIEPNPPHVAPGQDVIADLRIGDRMAGDHLIYIPQQTERLAILTADGMTGLSPRVGSRPVFDVKGESLAGASGHIMLIYQSANSYVHYMDQEKFFRFAEKKGAGHVRQAHAERHLPEAAFVERYKRFAKASMIIGDETGTISDRVLGMEAEFVMRGLRPASQEAFQLDVQLRYAGGVLPDAPVTLFIRDPDRNVTTRKMTTDRNGMVTLRAEAGHDYLLDHVTLRPVEPGDDKNRPVWESLWASLTFSGPPR